MEDEENLSLKEQNIPEDPDSISRDKNIINLEENGKEKNEENFSVEIQAKNAVNSQTSTRGKNRTAHLCYDAVPFYVVAARSVSYAPNGNNINPMRYHLLPSDLFNLIDFPLSLEDFQVKYFQNRTTKIYRFEHKLYNALKITKESPHLKNIIGAWWKTSDVFIVNLSEFGALIGASNPSAQLAHESGLFSVHGFEDVTSSIVKEFPDEFTLEEVYAYRHSSGLFTSTMTENSLDIMCGFPDTGEEPPEEEPEQTLLPPVPQPVTPPGVHIQSAKPTPAPLQYVSKGKYPKGFKTAVLKVDLHMAPDK